jgi:hypothetical protein
MSDEITISFGGPFSWHGTRDAPAVYDAAVAPKAGIYLWTVPLPDGHLIYYVGETGNRFGVRLRQHYKELAAARYHIYSAREFAFGEKIALWQGRYDPVGRKSDDECRANCARLSERIREMALVIRFFLAPLSCDTRIRRRVEAAIALPLFDAPGKIGTFQDRGSVRYHRRTNSEEPVACVASSPVLLLGLPERFWA